MITINLKTFIKIFCFIILFFSINISSAQNYILKGKVLSKDHKPIEFVQANLFKNDTLLVKTAYSDSLGIFSFKVEKGKYRLVLQEDGINYFQKNLEIDQDTDLGEIQIDKAHTIEKVTITARKKLIEKKVDRLIFNVENSIVSQGVNGLDVLQNTPQIDLSSGDIQLIGKSNVKVMINDRFVNLSGEELKNYLRSLRSDNISKIEIITTPPAKYDAEGNSGLINIILKKNTNLGWKGNTTFSYIQRTYAGNTSSLNIYYTGKKLSLSLGFFGDSESKGPKYRSNVYFDSGYRKSSERKKEIYTEGSANMNINYSINKKNEIGFIYSGDLTKHDQKGKMITYFISKPIDRLDSVQYSPYEKNSQYSYHRLSAYYDLKFDTLGRKMNLYFNYLKRNNNGDNDFSTSSENSIRRALYNSDANYTVYSANLDFALPYEFATIEAGAKYAYLINESDISYFDFIKNVFKQNPLKSDNFDYKEGVFALYLSAAKKIMENWEFKIGLRYENTANKGYSEALDQTQKNKFDNFFPSAYLTYHPNKNNSFSIAYSKRINRPGFYSLNPYRIYSDIYSYQAGNPNLLPSYTHNLEFSYLYKNNLSITLYGSRLLQGNDYITTVSDNSNVIISRPMNYFNKNTIGINISYTYQPFKWFESYNTISGYYNESTSYLPQITLMDFSGYGGFLSTKNTFSLNQKSTSFLIVNFFQRFPAKETFAKYFTMASIDLGLRLTFMDKSLQINALVGDIFAQHRSKYTEYYPSYSYSGEIYNDMRHFNLSISYNFGNNKIKTHNKQINIQERNRLLQ